MSWREHNDRLIATAAGWDGYGTPRLVTEHHVGRIVMGTRRFSAFYVARAGFYSGAQEDKLNIAYEAAHKRATAELPK